MFYFLMHKDFKVALLDFNEFGFLEDKANIINKDHLPLPAQKDISYLKIWLEDRAIPKTRHGIKNLLRQYNIPTTNSLLLNNFGLSLTDSYWLSPINNDLTWEDVNLYKNNFSEAIIGEFNTKGGLKQTHFSPNSSLQGELKKKWVINEKGERLLLKGNYGDNNQQSLNEVVATIINQSQNYVPFVSYQNISFSFDEKAAICCICPNFIKDDTTEFIPAWEIRNSFKIKGCESPYHQFINGLTYLGLDKDYVIDFLSYQIMLDYLITNTDRHFNNFGVIRDTNSLKIQSFAPIYDCGNSMFWKESEDTLHCSESFLKKIKTHSFLEKEENLLRYVKDYNCIDLSKLPDIDKLKEIYINGGVSENKTNKIIKLYELKMQNIDKLQQKQYYQSLCKIESPITKLTPMQLNIDIDYPEYE